MKIKIAEDTSAKINEVSEMMGIKEEEFVDRAILLYIDNVTKFLEFKKEMKVWDQLSDEALLNFEKSL